MSKSTPTPPIDHIRLGAIQAAIWSNDTENGPRFSVTVERMYRERESNEWKYSGTFNRDDLLTLAKGVTSAYFPVSASVVSERVWKVLEAGSPKHGAVMHGFTYSGHPVGCAVGLANLEILERESMAANAAAVGGHLLAGLKDRLGEHPFIGDIRGEGLMIGVEFTADRARRRRGLA